jgi:hypothetical protein
MSLPRNVEKRKEGRKLSNSYFQIVCIPFHYLLLVDQTISSKVQEFIKDISSKQSKVNDKRDISKHIKEKMAEPAREPKTYPVLYCMRGIEILRYKLLQRKIINGQIVHPFLSLVSLLCLFFSWE